jgi:1,4-dihydroxy-2-naphthoate octaprenyltransferase
MVDSLKRSPVPGLLAYLKASRPMFLIASALAVLLGSSMGYSGAMRFDAFAFSLALFSVMCVHAGINVLNDVYDELNGTDRLNHERIFPFTGGSRAIQNGTLDLNQMRRWGILLLAISSMAGLVLLYLKGPFVLVFGVAGIAIGYVYSAPPIALASRALGEFAVALGFGVIIVTGAAWLQYGKIDAITWLVSIAVGLWASNILLINEVPDATADRAAGKRTLVVRSGLTVTAILYSVINIVAAFVVYRVVLAGALPLTAISLPLFSVIAGTFASYAILQWPAQRVLLEKAIKLTLAIHTLNCLWLIAWFLL